MNVGAGEIIFVAIFALIIFGPRKLPEIARQVGKAVREFRSATRELTDELRGDLEETPKPKEPRPGPRG